VNPLTSGDAKNKSKDIHLPSIDVSFASNRILSGASLTLAHGRRYGIIGRNGVGKSTLLRHLALREVPIPAHISVLFVEQEITGDETTALDSVLTADVWRAHLLREEARLNGLLAGLEAEGDEKRYEDARDEAQERLTDVHARLADMEAESGPARAAALLAGAWRRFGPVEVSHQAQGSVSRRRTRSAQQRTSVVVGGKCILHCTRRH
jgi:ATP-binding cassette subfamily F protein 3